MHREEGGVGEIQVHDHYGHGVDLVEGGEVMGFRGVVEVFGGKGGDCVGVVVGCGRSLAGVDLDEGLLDKTEKARRGRSLQRRLHRLARRQE